MVVFYSPFYGDELMPRLDLAIVTETYPPEVNGVAMTIARLTEGMRRNGHVQIVHIRLVVLVVVQVHGRGVEAGFKRIVSIRQRCKFVYGL